MQISRIVLTCGVGISALALCGCETPWYTVEPAADALIPPTNAGKEEISRTDLAAKTSQPADLGPFANDAVYMGDRDGYRYVHMRDMSRYWGFLGECDYAVPISQWPMQDPMPFTQDASKWRDVTWMDGGDAPLGVAQNPALFTTPSYPVGAPATKPAMIPANIDFTTQPAPTTDMGPSTLPALPPSTLPASPVIPATTPSTEAASTTAPSIPSPAVPVPTPATLPAQ